MTTNSIYGPALAPWSATDTLLRDADGHSIASGGNNRSVRGPELAASLRLAAAAPDLLHALRLMMREHDALQMAEGSTNDRWPAATIARAAIARATGGDQ